MSTTPIVIDLNEFAESEIFSLEGPDVSIQMTPEDRAGDGIIHLEASNDGSTFFAVPDTSIRGRGLIPHVKVAARFGKIVVREASGTPGKAQVLINHS